VGDVRCGLCVCVGVSERVTKLMTKGEAEMVVECGGEVRFVVRWCVVELRWFSQIWNGLNEF
jgi:hypothetical protein